MLPAIGWQARLAFRDLDPEAREEAVEEAVAVAKRFRISPGRVSQLRNELAASWRQPSFLRSSAPWLLSVSRRRCYNTSVRVVSYARRPSDGHHCRSYL